MAIATLDCAMSSRETPRAALPTRFRPAVCLEIERVARRGPVLFPHPPGQESVLGLNLTEGCLHQCPFCAVRWQKNGSGEAVAGRLFADKGARPGRGMVERRRLPRGGFI